MKKKKPKYVGLRASTKRFEKKIIKKAFLASGSNVEKAAKRLKIPRPTLYRRLSAFGLI